MNQLKRAIIALSTVAGLLGVSLVAAGPAQAVQASVVYNQRDASRFHPVTGEASGDHVKLTLTNGQVANLAFGASRTANVNRVCPQSWRYRLVIKHGTTTSALGAGSCYTVRSGGSVAVGQYRVYVSA